MDPTVPIFNTAWRFDIGQSIDPAAFRSAFSHLVSAADVLRLVIRADEQGVPELVDLGRAAGLHHDVTVENAEAASQWIEKALRRPFDIATESFESALIRVGDKGWTWYLNQHHAIVDASSGSLLFDALSKRYETREQVHLPSFMNHAAGEANRINADHAAHWESTARAVPPPRIYGRQVSGRSSKAAVRTVTLGPKRTRQLHDLISRPEFRSLSRDMSLYNVFLTAFGAWMHRITGESRIPTGIVTHGRSSAETRALPGCLIEIFPAILECKNGYSFQELHKESVERSLALFRKASPGSSSPRALSGFNAVLNFVTTRFGPFAGEMPEVTWLDNGHIDQHHAIRLNVTEFTGNAGLQCVFAFNLEVFDEARQEAAIDQFLALLDAFLEDPGSRIDSVPLAAEDDASSKLTRTKFSATPVTDVIEAFETHLAEDPDAVMLVEGGRSFSRRMLAERSDSIAHALAGADVQPGDRVGLYLPRSADLVAAMLATLKIGASFVPLDASQTEQRLSAMAGEADTRVTLTEPRLRDHWQPPGATLSISDIANATAFVPRTQGDHPAYVILTSGTTGVPKGVEITRSALSLYAHWANRVFADDKPATWPLFSAIGFDLTITSIFAPIVTGGAIRVYENAASGGNTAVLDVFAEDAVDVIKLTPAHLRLVLAGGIERRKRIRSLILGGEDLATDLAASARDALGANVRIFNEYGPTEATVGCMIHEFDPARDRDVSVPIGRPADDTGIYILDKGMNPVPDLVAGDLYIAGPDRLARGYFRRPAETRAAFIKNPFAEGVMYRSGDIASVRPDGTILFHGRADKQVKISGVRIETGEIRAAAQAIDGIEDCAVVLFDPEAAARQLCRTCGIPKAQPGVRFAEPDLCLTCKEFERYRKAVDSYFGDLDELADIIRTRAAERTGEYDCVMLLSGGKDSTYALSRLMQITDRVLVATLDNGFISDGAKKNIRMITEALGVEHRYLSTPAMNDIFVDSLKRHANVCQGCFKTIYTLGLHLARDVGAPTIVTGLSRGQLFETRLSQGLFTDGAVPAGEIDRMVLEARRSYHDFQDVAAKRLNCGLFDDPEVLDRIAFVDFYRYCDVPMSEMYRHLKESVGWSRPMDTGRSTNCLINDVGIHVHRTRRAFHNYALPYSWDVRLGHKTRAEALDELNDEIDADRVASILDKIGFDEPVEAAAALSGPQLTLYYVSASVLSPGDLRAELLRRLPREVVPKEIVQVPEIPLTANGKISTDALPTPDLWRGAVLVETAPVDDSGLSDEARALLAIWRRVLGQAALSADTNFYDAGGDSLAAIQISTQANAAGIAIGPQEIFHHQSVAEIISHLSVTPEPAKAEPATPRRALSSRDTSRLEALFGRKPNG